MKIVLENIGERRAEWLEIRKGKMTSSKIATVCGHNQFQTPLELWCEETGKTPPCEENDDMWLGTEMQPTIMRLIQRRHQILLSDANCIVQDEQHPFALASPDCWELTAPQLPDIDPGGELAGITEIKNTNLAMRDRWSEEPPLGAQIQLQWQLGVCKLPGGHLGGLIGGSARRLKYFEIEAAQDFYEHLLEKACRFLKLIEQDIPPVAGPGDLKLIAKITGARAERTVDLSDKPDAWELIERWKVADERHKVLKDEMDGLDTTRGGIKARFAQLLGPAQTGLVGDAVVTAKMIDRKAYPVAATSYLDVRVKLPKPKGA